MPDARDPRSVIEEAERAATAGDYFAAERLLCDAASQQEAILGPFHPDLANTLNNLAVVYETIDRPSDAERCYRRAYAIAVTALEPDHPFVATSEKNFRDFCSTRGIPFDPPIPLPGVAPPPVPSQIRIPEPPLERPAIDLERLELDAPRPPATPSRSRAIGVISVLGMAALAAAILWWRADSSVESLEPAAPVAESSAVPVPVRESAPAVESIPAPVPPKTVSKAEPPQAVSDVEHPKVVSNAGRNRPVTTAAAAKLTVDEADLCRDFAKGAWRCNPASTPVDPGQLFFYTRIKSSASTTVEHRWYQNDRLHRVVSLRIQENQRSGFRTYSRTAVKPGDWRVELRTPDGAVLHREAFVVR